MGRPYGVIAIVLLVESCLGVVVGWADNKLGSVANWLLWDSYVGVVFSLPVCVALVTSHFPRGPLLNYCVGFRTERGTRARNQWWHLGVLFVAVLGASIALSIVGKMRAGEYGRNLLKDLSGAPFYVLWLVVRAAIFEELIFRGFLFPRLAKLLERCACERRVALVIAACVSSAVFAAGHAQLADPMWYKVGQAFFLGVVLCRVTYKFSIDVASVFHALFNATVVLLAFWLDSAL